MAHDVFISYSTKDKAAADAVCQFLEARKIRCWYAPRDVLAGAEWGASLVEAIESSRVMVLVFSAAANDSANVRREIERAAHNAVTIIPMRIEDVLPGKAMDYFLSSQHWLDALSSPLTDQHLEKLAMSVSQHLERELEPTAESHDPDPASQVTSPLAPTPRARARIRWLAACGLLLALVFVMWRFGSVQEPTTGLEVASAVSSTPSESRYDLLASIHEGNTIASVEERVGSPQVSRVIEDGLTANYVKNSEYLLTLFYRDSLIAGFTVISIQDGFSPGVDLGVGEKKPLGEFTFVDASTPPKASSTISGRSISYYVESLESGPANRFVDLYLGSVVYGAGGAPGEIDRVAEAELREEESVLADALLALRTNGKPNLYGEGRITLEQLEASLLTHAEFASYFGSH